MKDEKDLKSPKLLHLYLLRLAFAVKCYLLATLYSRTPPPPGIYNCHFVVHCILRAQSQ